MKKVKVMEEEWDVLILLDAMRYDVFEMFNDIKGKLTKVESLNSGTWFWIKDNFDKEYPDLIYVSGNPMVSKFKLSKIERDKLFEIVEAWDWCWNPKNNGVNPECVTRTAVGVIKDNPNKRILVHYLQPHFPWINKPEANIGRGLLLEWTENKEKKHLHQMNDLERDKFVGIIWDYVKRGKVSVEDCREGYIGNVVLILEEVRNLLKEIPKSKKVVIAQIMVSVWDSQRRTDMLGMDQTFTNINR